jgi:hypothetical protein
MSPHYTFAWSDIWKAPAPLDQLSVVMVAASAEEVVSTGVLIKPIDNSVVSASYFRVDRSHEAIGRRILRRTGRAGGVPCDPFSVCSEKSTSRN